jgi:hypothetical protein
MTQRIAVGLVLVLFAAQTLKVLAGMGYIGFLESINLNDATRLTFADLAIALTLVLVWIYRDAAAAGRRFWPYAVVTLLFGSAGPLAYLLLAAATQCAAPASGARARRERGTAA